MCISTRRFSTLFQVTNERKAKKASRTKSNFNWTFDSSLA